MDRDRCLLLLEAYGVGPKMMRLIKQFWDQAELACRVMGVYCSPFKSYRGVTQGGGRLSPKILMLLSMQLSESGLLKALAHKLLWRGMQRDYAQC